MSVTITVNDSPFAGTDGNRVTSTLIRERLLAEAETNVAKVETAMTKAAGSGDQSGLLALQGAVVQAKADSARAEKETAELLELVLRVRAAEGLKERIS